MNSIITVLIILPFWIASLILVARKSYLNGVNHSVGSYLQGIKLGDARSRTKANPYTRPEEVG